VTPKRSSRVHVVDDEASGWAYLVRLLQQDGYVIDSAEDGPSALHVASEHPPDVVVTDLKMPDMFFLDEIGELPFATQ